MPDPYSTFGLSCPSGGSFYICQNDKTEFIGCCTIDPCRDGSGSCPQSNLRNSSFSADSYDGLKPQDCADSKGLFYTCKYNKPPFLGCCARNPCASGSCTDGDLVPAKLSSDADKRDIFLTTAPASTPSPTVTSAAPPSSQTASTSSTPTASADKTGTHLAAGTIAGIAVGVTAIVLIFIASCVYIFRRGWHARMRSERGSTTPFLSSPPEGGFKSPISSPPFTPYRDTPRSNTAGLGSPPPFGIQSPPMSNYALSPYIGTTSGDAPTPGFARHGRTSSYASELGSEPPRIQELETEHNSHKFVRAELPTSSDSPTLAPTVPKLDKTSNTPLRKTPPPTTSTLIPPDPVTVEIPEARPQTPVRRSRESSINKDLPKTPPRTPPPVLVSPETSPILVSRFSASRREAGRGLNIMDSPTISFAASQHRGEGK